MTGAPHELLRAEGVSVLLPGAPPDRLVDDVDVAVHQGECLGLVGESGSGKSLLLRSALDLVPPPLCTQGRYLWRPSPDVEATPLDRRRARGHDIGMIFQEPMRALNPSRRIVWTLSEPLRQHLGLRGAELRDRVLTMLEDVGIPDPIRISRSYPHELSGGLQQRVMIAAALSTGPRLLLCDEPTTALDVTTQATILELLRSLQATRGLSLVFVSHDLAVISEIADRVAVMSAGRLVEVAPTRALIEDPRHEYTRMLLDAIPGRRRRGATGVPT